MTLKNLRVRPYNRQVFHLFLYATLSFVGASLVGAGSFWSEFSCATAHAALSPVTHDIPFKGRILDRENRGADPLFLFIHEVENPGANRIVRNTFTTLDGKPVVKENVEFSDGKVMLYEQQQLQLGTVGKIEIKGAQVEFSYGKPGETKTSTEKLKDNFVVTASLVAYVQRNWDVLSKGDALNIRLGVVDRRETVGFTLKKEKDVDWNGKKAVRVRMKPTSFLISALVDPLHFTFQADGSRLLELEGRVTPKREKDGKFRDFDAVTIYEYLN